MTDPPPTPSVDDLAAAPPAVPAAPAAPDAQPDPEPEAPPSPVDDHPVEPPLHTGIHPQAAVDTARDHGWPRPTRTRVLVVANQKGGVGKTTTTVNVAAALAGHGAHLLIIDLDPQGNASTALGVEHGPGTRGTYEALMDGVSFGEVLQPCEQHPGIDVVPATADLAGAEIELVSVVARESRLQRALDRWLDEAARAGRPYDYVFVDCPPSLGLLTINAMTAAREVLVPIQAEYYALEGLSQLLTTVEMVRKHLNADLSVSSIVMTMYDARTRLAGEVAAEVRTHFPEVVLKTSVPRSVRISEAPSHGRTVLGYDPASAGAWAYLEVARELAQRDPAGAGSGGQA